MGVRDEPIAEIEINKLGLRTETYKGWAGDIVYIKNQTDENLYIDLTANED